MSWFSNLFKSNTIQTEQIEQREQTEQPEQIEYIKPFSNGGLFFTQYTNNGAMALSAIFAATEIISNSIAELPIQIKENNEDYQNIIINHPILKMFDKMLLSKFIFMKQMVTDMLLHGNSFAYIVRDTEGMPIDLIYLEKGSVNIVWNKNTSLLYYLVTGYKNVPSKVYPQNMIHLYKNSNNGYEGKGILAYANRTVQIGNFTEEAAKDYFGSGCNIKGILKFKGRVMDDQKEAIRQNWQQVHGGSNGSGLAICEGDADFVPISQNASESQMIESRTFNISEVARYFNISPVLLSDLSHSSYSTIEASQLEFLTHTLLPYISLIESEFNRKLINQDNLYIDLDENYLMTADKSATANYLGSLVDKGILCINEARKQLGLGPVEGGDKHRIAYSNADSNDISKNTDKHDDE